MAGLLVAGLASAVAATETATARPAAASPEDSPISASPEAGQFYPTRVRIMDNAQVPARGTTTIQVTGQGGLPTADISSVALNIGAKGDWFNNGTLTIYPSGAQEPTATAVSYNPNYYASNMVITKVGADGKIKVANKSDQPVRVYLDVHGYALSTPGSAPGSTYNGLPPARLVDKTKIASMGNFELSPLGEGGVPASGVDAVAVRLTLKGEQTGTVRVYAAGDVWPADANVDYPQNITAQTFSIAKIGQDGRINVHNLSGGAVEVSVDVVGYFTKALKQGATIVTLQPGRLAGNVTIPANGDYALAPRGKAGIPDSGTSTVGINVTASSAGTGALSVTPSSTNETAVETVAYAAGRPTTGFTTARLGGDGKAVIHNSGTSPVTISVDAFSYYADPQHDITAEVADGTLKLAWRPRQGAGEYVLMDAGNEEVAWRGNSTSTNLPMPAPTFRTLILAAVEPGTTISYLGKILATAPDPQSEVAPMTVVTSASGTDIKWASDPPGTDVPPIDSTLEHRIAADDGTVVDVPLSRASTTTALGQSATFTVATGGAEVPEKVDDENSPDAPADPPAGTFPDDPPAVETGDGVPIDDPTTPTPAPSASTQVEAGPATTDDGGEDPNSVLNDVVISPPAMTVDEFAALAGLGTPSQTSIQARSAEVGAQGLTKGSTWVDYETYIPSAKVHVIPGAALACLALKGQWYAGDGRGVGHNTGKYRTRVAINLDWKDKKNFAYRDVHSTHRLAPTYATKTASVSGITFKASKNTGKYARIFIDHGVGNPFCYITSIEYRMWLEFYKNGEHWVYGRHVRMPSHQVYQEDFYYDSAGWHHYGARLMFNHPAVAAMCLAAFGAPAVCGYKKTQVVQ
ncbi:hypothetical protein [Actinomadura rubteroloni]|uniref:hypothetical protein n=1 Tax=Actinomadura rubteroloni TaxID=1926885 RepID=UPI0011B0DF8E|nr:hypothetical protein [Actinomadura rubteroloni]